MTGKKITASVVLYNTPKSQVDALLKSVLDSACVEKFFVIDNSPNDKWRILEKESDIIRYIHNENLGYGASHNLAIREAAELGADYHVVLNPDIRFWKDVLSALADFMEENPDAGCVMPKVVHPDGGLQYLCKLLPAPSDLIFRRFVPPLGFLKKRKEKKDARYCLKSSGYDRVMNPPCLSGCFMFLRLKTLFENRVFFDERFFMYFEDFDFVRRLHRVSRTLYFPDVSIVHEHARESYKNRKMLAAHIKSAVRYFRKYGWMFDRERREMNARILREIEG
ncbi:MAG: glycosyltransferase [Bacteroides sp.]|nr:glycosyltransferase [Prevotella sp.]MCM1407094.1 glycosyltransferase [Treponema brennaborense]MCM1470246.1 glycosyltransferase [Bacteroides sp.]